MREQIPVDFRNVSLEKLGAIKSQTKGPDYQKMVKHNFRGREYELLKTRLLCEGPVEHDKELERQEELIGFLEADLQKACETVDQEEKFINGLYAQREEICQRLRQVQEELAKVDRKLLAAGTAMNKFQVDKTHIEEAMNAAKKRKKDISRIVLVHKSANIRQLMKYSYGRIIVTQADAKVLSGVLTPDEVFKESEAENLFEGIPYSLSRLSKEDALSIIQFINMAMYYYLENGTMPIMLYASLEVSDILKKEGLAI